MSLSKCVSIYNLILTHRSSLFTAGIYRQYSVQAVRRSVVGNAMLAKIVCRISRFIYPCVTFDILNLIRN